MRIDRGEDANTAVMSAEWVLANHRGSYALGRGDLINTRKYHGLLIASDALLMRNHLVASFEERYDIEGESFFCDSSDYAETLYPWGYAHLAGVWYHPYPVFLYSTNPFRDEVLILKELLMATEENTVLLRYTNLGCRTFDYTFRCKFSLRDHHVVNTPGTFDAGSPSAELFAMAHWKGGCVRRDDNGVGAYLYTDSEELAESPVVFRNVHYSCEFRRGYADREDLYAPFVQRGGLEPGSSVLILLSDVRLDLCDHTRAAKLSRYIWRRYARMLPRRFALQQYSPQRQRVVQLLGKRSKPKHELSQNEYLAALRGMLEAFQLRSDIVAGLPWHARRGRDAMISLKAFQMVGDYEFVYTVLSSYGNALKNAATTAGTGGPANGSVDVGLWFVLRVFECLDQLPSAQKRELFSFCQQIIAEYLFRQDLPFFTDVTDSLLTIRSTSATALTWMDAQVGGVPVTARHGKPIEVNSLWYAGLRAVHAMAESLGEEQVSDGQHTASLEQVYGVAARVRDNLGRFHTGDLWCDRLEEGTAVREIRPNFVIACSLPFDFTDGVGLHDALRLAREELLTPFGLRTLSPRSPLFRRKYHGHHILRDLAYHQGTVWTWLLLPYAQLLAKTVRDQSLKEHLVELVQPLREAIRKGRLATVPEVWDGHEPCVPRGAPAHACSVAALVCVERMISQAKQAEKVQPAKHPSGK